MMIKPTTEPSPVFRRPIEQTIAAVDTLKTSFLPNLNTDSIISNYCPICGQSFSRQNLLAEHMQLNHHSAGVLFATQLSSGTSKIEFPCLSCDEKFSSGFDLDEHNRITHQTFLTRCISCGLYGMSSPSGNLIDGGEYKCQHCGAISSATMIVGQHTYVDQHMQHFVVGESENETVIVTPETQEKSPESSPKVPPLTVKLNKTKNVTGIVIKQEPQANSNEASSESLFLQHSTLDSTSNSRTRHKCPDCPRSFKTTGTLAKHRKIHTGETDLTPKDRPYTCTYCGKSFTQSNTLKQHIRIHTGEKPFTCSYCEKSFSVKDYLTKHIRTHTGEKPYQCPYCDKRFTQRSALTVHATKLHPVQQ